MYVRRLELRDLRAFRGAAVEMLYPGREREDAFSDVPHWPARLDNVNVFLGNNGSGKSTLLDAIALALISPLVSSSGYRPQKLIRRSSRGQVHKALIDVDVVLHAQDGHPDGAEAHFSAVVERQGDIEFLKPTSFDQNERYYQEGNSAFFFVGYGASRRAEAISANDLATRRRVRAVRYERVATLFEDHLALVPLNAWLPGWSAQNPGRHKQVVNLLNKLLPPHVKFTGELEDGEYLYNFRSLVVPFTALSDGYRAYLSWVGDLLYHVCMGAPPGAKLVDSRGVVMVDEIDLHIHPAWQRTVIPTLARTLKKIQFILTTHSPLIVSTIERANIYNVEMAPNATPRVSRPTEETFGLSADQILRSEVFGLDSTRDPEFTRKLQELSQAAQRGESGAALAYLRSASAGGGEPERDPGEIPDWLQNFATKD